MNKEYIEFSKEEAEDLGAFEETALEMENETEVVLDDSNDRMIVR